MSGSRSEAHAAKQCRQLEADLNWVRKRIPGRGVCDDLERIAAMLRFDHPDWVEVEDAKVLDSLATRLRELRAHLRSPGRHERAQAEVRAAVAIGDPTPSDDTLPKPSLSAVLDSLARTMGRSDDEAEGSS